MKVVLVQQDIVWSNPEANVERLEALLSGAPQADLYVLPEMFTTGFATAPEGVAEEMPAKGLLWMRDFARRRDCAIAGSIAVHEGDHYCNRLYFVTPESETYYDKRHLFTYSGEHLTFKAGEERKIVEWRGWKFLLLVCYDLRFPVWIRNRGDYDAIINVANWPTVRQTAWDTLSRARAIENTCYMLSVNRFGTDPKCVYEGNTAIYDPYGEIISNVRGREGLAVGELDMDFLKAYHEKFPALEDADEFEILNKK